MLQTLFRKKRPPRTPRDIAVLMFDDRGGCGSATLVDISDGGARLACADKQALAQASIFLIVERAEAYELRLVWRIGGQAGFQILRSCNVRGYVDPQFQAAKEVWQQRVIEGPYLAQPRFFGGRSR